MPLKRFVFTQDIFTRLPPDSFRHEALSLFRYQARHNAVYRKYLELLGVDIEKVHRLQDIPFLPVELFKTQQIRTGNFEPQAVFESSTTTGQQPGRHYIHDIDWYNRSLLKAFEHFFGPAHDYVILALLPGYLERGNASLVHMAKTLMEAGNHSESGFYLDEMEKLSGLLGLLSNTNRKVLLLGVTFALLDLAERYPAYLGDNIMIMETGGMKGRRKELTRMEVHTILKKAFQQKTIYSEYGMTELLSQAYMTDGRTFRCPPWMQVLPRDPYDPLTTLPPGHGGGLNIIDLANVHSCAFLATGDQGRVYEDGRFEVVGRLDNTDVRGCNLMVG